MPAPLHDCRFQFRRRPRPAQRKLNVFWLLTIKTLEPKLRGERLEPKEIGARDGSRLFALGADPTSPGKAPFLRGK